MGDSQWYPLNLKGTVKEKWNGNRLKANHLALDRDHESYSDFPVSRNWYKTVSKLYQIVYSITSPKLPPIAVQYTGHVYHVTTIPQCYWRKFLWRHTRLYRLYIRFGIILTQFYINFSRQEHQLNVLYVSFKTWDFQVSAYTPFHFSFTVPLNIAENKTC